MAESGLCEDLKEFELQGVINTAKELRKGLNSLVVEIDFQGLKCEGRKIRSKFYNEATSNEQSNIQKKLEHECRILSKLRHPSIVQFLGVVYDLPHPLPIVVTEFLPVTLSRHLKKHGVLPCHVSYSVLDNVATGLCYLHGHKPKPIVHGSLTADNVLLTCNNKSAKIAYFGEPKILELKSPLPEPSACTEAGATVAHTPSCKTDTFSFGILIIHMFTGNYPTVPPDSDQGEIEFALQQITEEHPLIKIVKQCLNTGDESGPKAADIQNFVHSISLQYNNNVDDVAPPDPQAEQQHAITTANQQLQSHNMAMLEELRLTAGVARSYASFKAQVESIDVTELKIINKHLEEEVKRLQNELEAKRITLKAKNDTITQLIDAKEYARDAALDLETKQKESMLKDEIISIKQKRIENLQHLITTITTDMVRLIALWHVVTLSTLMHGDNHNQWYCTDLANLKNALCYSLWTHRHSIWYRHCGRANNNRVQLHAVCVCVCVRVRACVCVCV